MCARWARLCGSTFFFCLHDSGTEQASQARLINNPPPNNLLVLILWPRLPSALPHHCSAAVCPHSALPHVKYVTAHQRWGGAIILCWEGFSSFKWAKLCCCWSRTCNPKSRGPPITLHLCAAGVWRRSAFTAAWAAWRSLMSASPGRSRFPAGVSLRRWSGRWGRRRGSCSRTGQPLLAPPSSKPSWDPPPSSRCSSTSASCRDGCPLEEVSWGSGVENSCSAEMSDDVVFVIINQRL